MNTQLNQKQHNKNAMEFIKWLFGYGIGDDSHNGLSLEEQFEEVYSEVTRLKGSEIDKFSFCCGGVASIAHLQPDTFQEFYVFTSSKDKAKK